jgi:multisubunit Na+/H+ antiporter MnhB subunit
MCDCCSAKTWPFVLFFAVAIGGPYLIWRWLVAPGLSFTDLSIS